MEPSRRKNSESSSYQEFSKRKDKNRVFLKSHYNRSSDWRRYEPVSEFSAGQWHSQGQRLYPTMSDSAMCGYSFPCDYTINSGYQIYPVCSSNVYPIGPEHSRHLSKTSRTKNKFHDTDPLANSNSNFTSLPPVNIEDVDCSQKRRFSDPGLNNVDESNESSSGESLSEGCSITNESFSEQISELKSENKRLVSELEITKNELKTIKSEFALISNKVSCHEPFSLAQMVKEIRDAAQIRENILFAKVESLMEKRDDSVNMANMVNEVNSLKKRLSTIEHQLEHLRIHSKVDSKSNGDATLSEIENVCKKKLESKEKNFKSPDNDVGKKEERNSNQLNLNSDTRETGPDCNGNSLSTVSSESLSSSLGPGSLHSAHVTLCGPVTDL